MVGAGGLEAFEITLTGSLLLLMMAVMIVGRMANAQVMAAERAGSLAPRYLTKKKTRRHGMMRMRRRVILRFMGYFLLVWQWEEVAADEGDNNANEDGETDSCDEEEEEARDNQATGFLIGSLPRNEPIIPMGTLKKAAMLRTLRIFSIMLYISLIFC